MKKFYLNMVLALTVAFIGFAGVGMEAKAEILPPYTWEVFYKGNAISSTYDKNKSIIENAMPGDTIAYTVQYHNDTDASADFYMNADVVKTLEEGSKATGGAYSYKIETSGSKEPLFDSETIGGDAEGVDAIIGLNQVNGNEGAYFSLGTVAAHDHGTVTVTVVLDGNSQNNAYMSTLGSLEIKFGAEPTSSATHGDNVENHNTVVKKIVQTLSGGNNIVIIDDDAMPTSANPQTGDSILPLVLCSIALVFGLLLILWYFRMTKDENEEVA